LNVREYYFKEGNNTLVLTGHQIHENVIATGIRTNKSDNMSQFTENASDFQI
jgi:hypothetical protein